MFAVLGFICMAIYFVQSLFNMNNIPLLIVSISSMLISLILEYDDE